ncbi:MAG: CHASE2 domain-containing protein [Hyellaceae cyanobacterium CSU_1_1]|nr:CHASE2 domain-containing protein [Hyellaceae cyanobacterium CSU_1_1]
MWQKVTKEIAVWRAGAMPGIAVIFLVFLARAIGGLEFLELTALDSFLRWRSPEPVDDKILIVGINEQDINNLAKYPISDRELANLITTLESYNPVVIGIDLVRDKPQEPGSAELEKVFSQQKNVIGVEKVLSNPNNSRINLIKSPHVLPAEQIGFVDILLDQDGNSRRSLLTMVNNNELKFSLPIRLVEQYLATKNISLKNAPDDPETMQVGQVELTRVNPQTGGYIRTNAEGNQVLLNFRRGENPFRIVSLEDMKQGKVQPAWIKDRIVLIGITALSVRDDVNTNAVRSNNTGFIYGVEFHAHAVSQIISAVLDDRPLLWIWHDGAEYLWIFAWGFLGIGLARLLNESPWKLAMVIFLSSVLVALVCYLLLLEYGLWLPVVSSVLVLFLNGLGLTASMFYRDRQNLKFQLKERQYMIKYMASTIHNRPIQTLKKILREAYSKELAEDWLIKELNILNEELREIGNLIEKETIIDGNSIHIGKSEVDLQCPLTEILYQVYSNTIRLDYPNFKTIKFKINNFEDSINGIKLTVEQKRSLCRFLEEAIINVGKYAEGVTRLKVVCLQKDQQNMIRVEDNGIGLDSNKNSGGGTKQANDLAKQLRGEFKRYPREPKGTICELSWSGNKGWFWHF